jgi:hypothetical protein
MFHTRPRSLYRLILVGLALVCGANITFAITPWSILINTNYIVYVTNSAYGAVGNGVNTNTTAIQAAINAATLGGVTNGLVGGTVDIPASGIYLCGPLTLANNVNIQVDAGAILRMLPLTNYPGGTVNPANFISGSSVTNIEVSGPGAIDGQGAPWWPYANTNGANRPVMISLNNCKYEMVQNITLSNSPEFHIAIGGGSAANSTVQNCIIRAPASEDPLTPGHNTDADDVSGTNILIQNNNISVGDDDFTCGGGTSDILITNNTYGNGHGVSIGSFTSPYVSNMLVINCTFNGTDQGIRIKSDRDRGGFVHNINYINLSMTNVEHPIEIYCDYTNTTPSYSSLDKISPQVAESYPAATYVSGSTPTYRDITFSNITATGQSGRAAGLIWGLPECSISNLTLINVNLSADTKTFGIYDVSNAKLINCTHTPNASAKQFSFFNSQVVLSNSTPSASVVTLDGATTNAVPNNFEFDNFLATLQSTNALDQGSSISLNTATFTISNNLTLSPANILNYTLGANMATLMVNGNLDLGGVVNVNAGSGFTAGTYTLMSCSGVIGGTLPTLGTVPPGYNYTLNINAGYLLVWQFPFFIYGGTLIATNGGLVQLVVTTASPLLPSVPAGLAAAAGDAQVALSWFAVPTATSYVVQRATINLGAYTTIGSSTGTNFTDTQAANGTTYYYRVAAVNTSGQGSFCPSVSATPQTVPMVAPGAIFTDGFSESTVNSASPTAPTPIATAYEIISSKSWNPTPSVGPGHLRFGIAATSSGIIEAQALFTNAPVTLVNVGDNLTLVVTFTNTAGLLTGAGSLGFGLYDSGQNFPVPGGLDGSLSGSVTGNAIGNAQTWAGYVGQLSYIGMNSQILARPPQTGADNNNQDAISTGASSSFANPMNVGTPTNTSSLTLTVGKPYTDALTISLVAANTLAITNSLYAGTSTSGTLLSQFGGVTAGTNFLATSFDAFAIGWRSTASTATAIDINQIDVLDPQQAGPALEITQPQVPSLMVTPVAGNQFQLSWPQGYQGWSLQVQTNSPGQGLGTNWVTVPNSANVISTNVTIDPANGSVFFRLVNQ